ncbi:acyl-CoA carboxylase subunit epsilon [Demequina sp.]|uniref:acyl-CoA carboxylase subunit epsilon n=1 Tax=Demequina sp. TaxID=2050685 RepID=UPI0025C55249|nr:acyl-CoA carboxylase subunit epsilon [Demequina sp.]
MSSPDDFVDAAAAMRVVRGAPDDDELAALVAGMVAMANAAEQDEEPGSPTSAWMDRARTMRGIKVGVLGRGSGAWRHSLR